MNIVRLIVVGLGVLLVVFTLIGIGTAGAHSTDLMADPVSTIGHVCDDWGWHNSWGNHQDGDSWTDHPHHIGHEPHASHGPLGSQTPHGHQDSPHQESG